MPLTTTEVLCPLRVFVTTTVVEKVPTGAAVLILTPTVQVSCALSAPVQPSETKAKAAAAAPVWTPKSLNARVRVASAAPTFPTVMVEVGAGTPPTPEAPRVTVAGVAVSWPRAFALSGRTATAPVSLLALNVSVRLPMPRAPVGENQTLKVQLPAAASAGAVQVKPLAVQVGAHDPWARVPFLMLNSLPAGSVKVSPPVPWPPALVTVTVAAGLVSVMTVSANPAVPRLA